MNKYFDPWLRKKPEPPVKPKEILEAGDNIIGTSWSVEQIHIPEDYDYFNEEEQSYYGPRSFVSPKEIKDLSLNEVNVQIYSDSDGHVCISFVASGDIENPYYEDHMRSYRDSMKWHKKSLKDWEKEKIKYDKEMIEYKKAKIRELEEEKAKLEAEL